MDDALSVNTFIPSSVTRAVIIMVFQDAFSIEAPSIPRDIQLVLAPGLAFRCQPLKHGVCLRDPRPPLPSQGISEFQRLYCSEVRKLCGMEIYTE